MAVPAPSAPVTTGPSGRPGSGFWHSVSSSFSRMPLRIKLIAALLTLLIAALTAISIGGAFVLRDYLHSNADQQISTQLGQFKQQVQETAQGGRLQTSSPSVICFASYLEAFVPAGGTQAQSITCPPFESGVSSLPQIPSTSWLDTHSGQLVTVGSQTGNDTWRLKTQQVTVQSPFGAAIPGSLIIGEDLGNINQTIGRLVSIDLIVGAIVVIGLAIVGIAVVRTSMQPLTEIERTAGKIAAGDLTQRVAERDPGTEVGSLGRSLNVMLGRIEAAFHAQVTSEANARRSENRMRRFIADASHELRTPLTTIRGYAEYYRQRGGLTPDGSSELGHEDLDRIMNRVEDEATRMGGLVEDLLLLARIDQQRPMERNPVDVLALAADAVQDARMVNPDREVTLTVGRDTAFLVLGDEARLRQVIGNLTGNALTHTPAGTPVEVNLRSGQIGWGASGPVVIAGPDVPPDLVPPPPGAVSHAVPAVVIEVIDHGPGLSAEQKQRVFERFYRADEARTRNTGGTGLGLAIVSALVTAHDGAVAVDSQAGQGATFRVALPLAPEAQDPGRGQRGVHVGSRRAGRTAAGSVGTSRGSRRRRAKSLETFFLNVRCPMPAGPRHAPRRRNSRRTGRRARAAGATGAAAPGTASRRPAGPPRGRRPGCGPGAARRTGPAWPGRSPGDRRARPGRSASPGRRTTAHCLTSSRRGSGSAARPARPDH
jgi:two-component system OmpR family sensor kinase